MQGIAALSGELREKPRRQCFAWSVISQVERQFASHAAAEELGRLVNSDHAIIG